MLHHMLRAAAARAFNVLDPYFQYVTMLLHGDGTNGAQNNTFLDSSTNAFTITRNGNTTQGSFSPYGSNWSNFFDGDGDGLTSATSSGFAFGTGDFTYEGWYYSQETGSSQRGMFDTRLTSNSTAGVLLLEESTNGFKVYINNTTLFTTTGRVANTWQHIALVRQSGTVRLYINGVQANSAASSTNMTDNNCRISGFVDTQASPYGYSGYISNARVVKGTCLYPSGTTFTPSTTPLTAVSGTSLLTCQSNRFVDNSASPLTITVNGSPSVQRFSPFSPTTAYSTSVIGGSMYLDGTTDFVKTPSDVNLSSTLLASNFTIECWIYLAAYPSSGAAIWTNSVTNADGFTSSYINANGTVGTGKVNVNEFNTVTTIKLNTWTHFAIVRNSGTLYVYFNGVQDATTGAASTYLNTTATKPMQIGSSNQSPPTAMQGYMSDFRVVASAVYTTGFTPNTAPLTAISGTNLLLSTTNAGILDNAMMNDLETVGNAQISTSVKKYGTGSLAFDGTGDYLVNPYTPNNVLGSGDFTVEMWLYKNANVAYMCAAGTMDASAPYNTKWQLFADSPAGTKIQWWSDVSVVISTSTLSTGVWYHVAVTRASGTTRIFINGTLEASASDTRNYSAANQLWVGQVPENVSARAWNGYIDDLRISKVARYTATFTPPTTAFPNN